MLQGISSCRHCQPILTYTYTHTHTQSLIYVEEPLVPGPATEAVPMLVSTHTHAHIYILHISRKPPFPSITSTHTQTHTHTHTKQELGYVLRTQKTQAYLPPLSPLTIPAAPKTLPEMEAQGWGQIAKGTHTYIYTHTHIERDDRYER
jgi:hypothetical protein